MPPEAAVPACLPAAERAAWLNTLLADVWPVLDPVACGIIKAAVEPLVAQFAPPFISRIGFRRLSLGDVPLTVEGIRVSRCGGWGWSGKPRLRLVASMCSVVGADGAVVEQVQC